MKSQQRLDDAALDGWMQRSLQDRYAAALREPLPDMLIKLLSPETSGS